MGLTRTPRPAIFLDRDGVLNEAVALDGRQRPPASPAELVLAPGAAEACARLSGTGLPLLVVTNQPDVARGTLTLAQVDAVNAELRRRLPVDDVFVCPHDDRDGCGCRKPAAGMLLRAARRWNVDLGRSVMVGDRWRDVDAGRRAGCATVLIDRGGAGRPAVPPDLTAASLAEAAGWIAAAVMNTSSGRKL